jgi:chromosome segregation ATPase
MSGIGGGGAMQATALAKQNEFLKGYIVRLQRQLEDYLGSYLPPPSSTSEREAEQLPPWIGYTTSLSPLLEAYDRRIAEADAAYESLSSQQAAIQARTRQLTAENERLMAEVKQLTSMAMARAEEGDLVIGSESSNAKVLELEEKLTLLTSENEVLVDECKVVREEMRKAEAQATTSAQQLKELREQNTVLRRRVAAQEVEDSQGAASMKSALAEAERKSSQSDRLRMELDAAEREVKVLAHELQSARHDLRVQAQTSLEARKRAEEQAERHQAERSR